MPKRKPFIVSFKPFEFKGKGKDIHANLWVWLTVPLNNFLYKYIAIFSCKNYTIIHLCSLVGRARCTKIEMQVFSKWGFIIKRYFELCCSTLGSLWKKRFGLWVITNNVIVFCPCLSFVDISIESLILSLCKTCVSLVSWQIRYEEREKIRRLSQESWRV